MKTSLIILILGAFFLKLKSDTDSPPASTNCVIDRQKLITGDCTHSETSLVLRSKSFSFQFRADGRTAISTPVIITISIGQCVINAKAYNTPDGNFVSVEGDIFGPSITIKGDSKSIQAIDPTFNARSKEINCVPVYDSSGSTFVSKFMWDLSVAEKSVSLQFDNSVEFNLPTTTFQSTTSSDFLDKIPNWAWIVFSITILVIILCILVCILICLYFCCYRRRKRRPKVDVAIGKNEPEYQTSELPIDGVSHLSIISDFESINEWRSEH